MHEQHSASVFLHGLIRIMFMIVSDPPPQKKKKETKKRYNLQVESSHNTYC